MNLLIVMVVVGVGFVGSPNVTVSNGLKKHQFEIFNKDCVKNDEHVKHNSSQIMYSKISGMRISIIFSVRSRLIHFNVEYILSHSRRAPTRHECSFYGKRCHLLLLNLKFGNEHQTLDAKQYTLYGMAYIE